MAFSLIGQYAYELVYRKDGTGVTLIAAINQPLCAVNNYHRPAREAPLLCRLASIAVTFIDHFPTIFRRFSHSLPVPDFRESITDDCL